MAKQPQSFFLEEWLLNVSFASNKIDSIRSSSVSAQSIIQSWANLRDSLQNQSFHTHHLQALKTLTSSQASVYVADPQAKLLISILSSTNLSLPQESYPLFFRLLYIWVRKSRQYSPVFDSAVDTLFHLFSRQLSFERNSLLLSESILILGALSFQTSTSEKSVRVCLDLICKLLEEEEFRYVFSTDELVSNVLAGIGYTLCSRSSVHFPRILDTLLRIWGREGGGSISQGLMLLHLVEWVLSSSLNLRVFDKIDLVREVLENVKPNYNQLALVFTASGVLRAINRSGSSGFIQLKNSAEERIENVAKDLVSKIKLSNYSENDPWISFVLQCIALALARSGTVSFHPCIFESLCIALLTEVFPLKQICNKILSFPRENLEGVLDNIKEHQNSVIFKEAGAITGIFCNQYASANENSRILVENFVWDYCQEVYFLHRQARLVLLERGENVIDEIEKIAESVFLMVVVFALGVTKHRLDSRIINRETQLDVSVRILVSFSCMEYFRRMRLPEYMETIRAVIGSVQENELACVSFVESMPSYDDLTSNLGSSNLRQSDYLWSTDEVQTARILFYMRVIPTFIERLTDSVIKKVVAPTMFLYMGHPNVKITRYSHSLFVSVVSSGKDHNQDGRDVLKEQLVFYYMQRSLEGFPGITPFEGLASGVVAIVRNLPAGSPSIFYCIHSLVEKVDSLCSVVGGNKDSDLWKNWEGELEPSMKVLDLLLRLLSLVDIQVLPSLMKSLAQLIVQIPSNGQNMILNQLYQQIADSDDVIRKPSLTSWLQSLSYLCSKSTEKNEPQLGLNTVNSRL